MIKLQVLKFMGILTIMKLGVFAVSALSLVMALTWILVYCPTRVLKSTLVGGNVHDVRNRMSISDYFDHYDAKLDREMKHPELYDAADGEAGDGEVSQVRKVVIPLDRYTDDAFESMITQVNERQLDGYEFLAESQNVTIYRQPRGNAGLYDYKLYAILPDANPEQIASVFLNNEYRVAWDQYVTELYMVQENEQGPDVIYFNVDFPWPLANRDYVYARETRRMSRDNEDYVVIVMHSLTEHNVPEVKGAIRVSDYHQSLAIRKWGERGSKAFIQYYDDPKGSIPSWLINWAAKTGVPAFLKDLQRACNGLPAFLEKKKAETKE